MVRRDRADGKDQNQNLVDGNDARSVATVLSQHPIDERIQVEGSQFLLQAGRLHITDLNPGWSIRDPLVLLPVCTLESRQTTVRLDSIDLNHHYILITFCHLDCASAKHKKEERVSSPVS